MLNGTTAGDALIADLKKIEDGSLRYTLLTGFPEDERGHDLLRQYDRALEGIIDTDAVSHAHLQKFLDVFKKVLDECCDDQSARDNGGEPKAIFVTLRAQVREFATRLKAITAPVVNAETPLKFAMQDEGKPGYGAAGDMDMKFE